VSAETAKQAMSLAADKLPIRTRLVSRVMAE
jgi:ribosomal protein L16/L10AE